MLMLFFNLTKCGILMQSLVEISIHNAKSAVGYYFHFFADTQIADVINDLMAGENKYSANTGTTIFSVRMYLII